MFTPIEKKFLIAAMKQLATTCQFDQEKYMWARLATTISNDRPNKDELGLTRSLVDGVLSNVGQALLVPTITDEQRMRLQALSVIYSSVKEKIDGTLKRSDSGDEVNQPQEGHEGPGRVGAEAHSGADGTVPRSDAERS